MLNKNYYYISFLILLFISNFFLCLCLIFLVQGYSLLFEWVLISLNSLSFTYVIYIDWISIAFSFVVLFISSIVILYRSVYIGHYNYDSLRFLLLVLIFVLRIILIILRPRMIRILLGWDGLGLVSYCLVIYYSSIKSYLAGIITCLINRLGDIGLLICISWIFRYGRWNFLFNLMFLTDRIFWLIIISSFTKRAQIPFSAWLPAAMAAPTPVSSLVHSSTLVTAGVYLLIRFGNSDIFKNDFFLFISLITVIISSLCARYEFDLKKIVALSTLSQLGLIMSCIFIGFKDLTFFHLLSHAIFKSLLFLCSGIIIHLLGGCQDIRSIGSLYIRIPLTCRCFNISNMALCGFPFLSGFYSKDFVIDRISFLGINILILIIFYLSLGLTSLYRIRLFYYTLKSQFNFIGLVRIGDNISLIKYRIIFLSFFSISFGCIYIWLINLDLAFLLIPIYLKVITLFIVGSGLLLGYELNRCKNLLSYEYYFLNGSMWFMYTSYSINLYKLSYACGFILGYQINWGEFYGGLGLSYYIIKLSNYIQSYLLRRLRVFFISLIVWLVILI